MGEVRIQSNSDGPRERGVQSGNNHTRASTKTFALPKIATYLQVLDFNVFVVSFKFFTDTIIPASFKLCTYLLLLKRGVE